EAAALGGGGLGRAHRGRRRRRRQVAVRGVAGVRRLPRRAGAAQHRQDRGRPADGRQLGRPGRPVAGGPQSRRHPAAAPGGRSRPDGGTAERSPVTVLELRSAAPELEQVTAMSWTGDSRLVVVGREKGGVEQMRYVEVDGSTPDIQQPAALTGVKAVTASPDDKVPLVAYSVDGIV